MMTRLGASCRCQTGGVGKSEDAGGEGEDGGGDENSDATVTRCTQSLRAL